MGSDHVDILAACDKKLGVYEVTGSNVTSVAEHVVMQILALVRNFIPAHEQIKAGEWKVADIARNAFDIENKVIGTLGAGRIGYRVLQRLVPFEPKELLYADYQPLTKGGSVGFDDRLPMGELNRTLITDRTGTGRRSPPCLG